MFIRSAVNLKVAFVLKSHPKTKPYSSVMHDFIRMEIPELKDATDSQLNTKIRNIRLREQKQKRNTTPPPSGVKGPYRLRKAGPLVIVQVTLMEGGYGTSRRRVSKAKAFSIDTSDAKQVFEAVQQTLLGSVQVDWPHN